MKKKRFGALSVLRHPRAFLRFLRNPDESLLRRAVALAAVLYVVLPIDLIPDAIPVLGWLDDIGVVALTLSWVANRVRGYVGAPIPVDASGARPARPLLRPPVATDWR